MRCFIAIELDSETRTLLTNIQKRLSAAGVKGNFARPENLHLTLKFLGEIDSTVFQKVNTIIKNITTRQQSFVLTVDRIGKFDKGSRKIIWAGLSGSKELEHLFSDINTEVIKILPTEKEKRYTPHITLIREAILPDNALNSNEELNHSFRVSGISLMESTRRDGKLTYLRRAYESFL
ncbi:MAG: RNA 2',3'-cyclic phosphodiesterase [Clostridiaceae bacterium]|jgi:2'-5' RNA ligase|nr:RNA 2',3'-cyclic phosphodiesterase [Clostridiaceae bacterium]